jgi:amidohydrolase
MRDKNVQFDRFHSTQSVDQKHQHSETNDASLTMKSDFKDIINKFRPRLDNFITLYKNIHRFPELGTQERRTALLICSFLSDLGLEVHYNIGGNGVVGVLKNGRGKTVLIRTELDALPVLEETRLSYASEVRSKDTYGKEVPVMHACGHDMNMACLLAATKLLHSASSQWSGTLIVCGQPDEERGGGAKAMVDDGLYNKVPVPDVILAQHVDHKRAGTLAIRAGLALAAANSFDVRIHGQGGHGSQPQNTIDPIVIASYTVVRLQSIVSRTVAPTDTAVVTVGSVHAGETENVIPDFCDLKLNVRTYKPDVRKKVLSAMHNIINSEAEASSVPTKPSIKATTTFPITENDSHLVSTIEKMWSTYFPASQLVEQEILAGSEDLPNLSIVPPGKGNGNKEEIRIPYTNWFLGGTDPKKWDDAVKNGTLGSIPRNHGSKFAPVIEPTLRTGTDAMALAVLGFLAL